MRIPQQILSWVAQFNPSEITDQELRGIALTALDLIEQVYYKYPTAYDKNQTGERVLAYEYYHILRTLFQECSHLDITGEPIKGPGVIPTFKSTIIPDVVIHKYGNNDNNKLAIEIKIHPRTTAGAILDDLRNLKKMVNELGYKYGIFVCANFDCANKIEHSILFKRKIKRILRGNHSLEIWNVSYDQESNGEKKIEIINYKNV